MAATRDGSMPLTAQFDDLAGASEGLGSPLYSGLAAAIAADLAAGGPCADALGPGDVPVRIGEMRPLAFLAGVHRLVLERRAPALAVHYPSVGGTAPRDAASWLTCRTALVRTVAVHVADLRAAAHEIPQTNEVGRCAGLAVVLREACTAWGLPVRLHEIGCSAGLSLRVDALVHEGIVPADRGDAGDLPSIVARIGSDLHPVDATTTEGRLRLTSFVVADRIDRIERLRAALGVAARVPVALRRSDALDHVRSIEPTEGATTVLWHSAMWMYLDEAERTAILAALDDAGRRASGAAPLLHVSLEPTGADVREFRLEVRTWPGDAQVAMPLATSGPEGVPLDWRQLAVGAVIRDGDGRLLVVLRRHEPAAGTWSIPGGRVAAGESLVDAVVREVREETGLDVRVTGAVGVVERAAPGGGRYVIHDFAAEVVGGHLRAGDDAADVRWVGPDELIALPTPPGMVEALREWGILAAAG